MPDTKPAAAESAGTVAMKPTLGIDVSHYSGSVDWSQVLAAGYTFTFAKATQGMDYQDPTFDTNWKAMKAAGIVRGAYHFYVTEDDPQAQASFFLSTVSFQAGDLAPVVDIETLGTGTDTSSLPDNLRQFLAAVEGKLNVKPIIYTSPGFWNQYLGAGFGDYPLWVAEYGVSTPKQTNGWTTWTLWQFQENATVPGVASGADVNQMNPSVSGLSTLRLP